MPTLYNEIDDMFLSDVADDSFFRYEEEDRQKILDGLRIKAITRFKVCKKDLSKRIETFYEEDNGNIVVNVGSFDEELSDEEKLIIATIMRKYWFNDKIYNLELIKQRMSSKDWKLTSQAEHLLRLTDLVKILDIEISRMIIDYSYYSH